MVLSCQNFLISPAPTARPNPWDPGSSAIILGVRDLDDIVNRLRAFGAPGDFIGWRTRCK